MRRSTSLSLLGMLAQELAQASQPINRERDVRSIHGEASAAGASNPDDLQLLFAEDLAEMFSIGLPAARKRLRLGQCGPFIRVGKRLAVLRTSFLEFLQRSQIKSD